MNSEFCADCRKNGGIIFSITKIIPHSQKSQNESHIIRSLRDIPKQQAIHEQQHSESSDVEADTSPGCQMSL